MRITRKHVAGGAMVLASAAVLIAPFEGYRDRTYRDVVGVPTVCYGETDRAAVRAGLRRTFTHAECLDMLAKSLPKYDAALMRCVRGSMPDSVHIAGISLAYNVGGGAVCRSTFVRLINAGDFRGACNALARFNRAGGRVIPGLVRRRAKERAVCLEGI